MTKKYEAKEKRVTENIVIRHEKKDKELLRKELAAIGWGWTDLWRQAVKDFRSSKKRGMK